MKRAAIYYLIVFLIVLAIDATIIFQPARRHEVSRKALDYRAAEGWEILYMITYDNGDYGYTWEQVTEQEYEEISK
jgi:hypothetical protein